MFRYMSEVSVQHVFFQDAPAVRLQAGGYEALIVPGLGANVIELSRPDEQLSFLRSPETSEQLRQSGQRYGIPPLFPPNRIEGGKFSTPHRDYSLPLNSSDGLIFMHGILHKRPWQLVREETKPEGEAIVTVAITMDRDGEMYPYFPHEFTYELTYTLSEQGLSQTAIVTNRSEEPMPLGIGFHTALRAPFHAEGQAEDYVLQVSAGEEWELTPQFLPTGLRLPLSGKALELIGQGTRPTGEPYAVHLTDRPLQRDGREFHGAVLTDTKRGISLVYEVSEEFRHWVLWNDDGASGFICPEPQTWAINAPNLDLPDAETGFQLLAPGQSWTATSRMYAVR